MLHRSFLNMAYGQSAATQPQRHDDQCAADAANTSAHGRSRMGLWARLVPARLRAAYARRAADRMLARSLARLSETSAHLLEDIGVSVAPKMPPSAAHPTQMRTNLAPFRAASTVVTPLAAPAATPLAAPAATPAARPVRLAKDGHKVLARVAQ